MNSWQDPYDQSSRAEAASHGNPPQRHQGYSVSPGHGYQGNRFISPSPTAQGQHLQNSQINPYFPGFVQQFRPVEQHFFMNYPNASMPGPRMIPPGHASYQHSFEPTGYANVPSVSIPMPISRNPSPYDNHDFSPQPHPRIHSRQSPGFQIEARRGCGGVQSSSMGSVLRSSGDGDSMRPTMQGKKIEETYKKFLYFFKII